MDVLFAETALLIAVRTVLRLPVNERGGGFGAKECEIEFDEMVPANVGDQYTIVMANGWQPGPRHVSSGDVHDLVYGVEVSVLSRTTQVPRDRMRDVVIGSPYIGHLDSLNDRIDRVIHAIDADATNLVLRTANALILKETGSTEGFIEKLKVSGIDKKPRTVPAETFGGTGTKAGLARKVYFNGARRITTRT